MQYPNIQRGCRDMKTAFRDEYLKFLDKHGVKYDEKYVWGDSKVP
jgi:hypothetical protein